MVRGPPVLVSAKFVVKAGGGGEPNDAGRSNNL